jgi:hypothetical protein
VTSVDLADNSVLQWVGGGLSLLVRMPCQRNRQDVPTRFPPLLERKRDRLFETDPCRR